MSQQQPSSILSNAQIVVPDIKEGRLQTKPAEGWNIARLGLRLGADAASAATASSMVAPVICIIDQYDRCLNISSFLDS